MLSSSGRSSPEEEEGTEEEGDEEEDMEGARTRKGVGKRKRVEDENKENYEEEDD